MTLIELLKVIFLGVVEGITEWLPISSTGHMILVDEFIHLNISDEFKDMFLVVIQLGAILAVVVLYFKKLFPFNFSKKATSFIDKDKFILWFKIIVACLPAALIGPFVDDFLEEHLYNYVVVALMLIVYGIFFLLIEHFHKNKSYPITTLADINYKTAFYIGLFQLLSLIPGTSRSGATILGAMLVGTSRTAGTEFSFFLAIPVMFGASLLKIVKYGFVFTHVELLTLFVGMLVAFIVSIIAIKFLLNYLRRNDFKAFGYYRIILGILVIAYFLFTK